MPCFSFLHSLVLFTLPEPKILFSDLYYSITFGSLGVGIFFIISGYLITVSWLNSSNGKNYLTKRVLRIYPGLFINVLITVFIFGLISTTLTTSDYLFQILTEAHLYLLSALVFSIPDLPGAFSENVYTLSNGALWTLPIEFLCYLLVALFGFKFPIKKSLTLLLPVALLLGFHAIFYPKVALLDFHTFTFFTGAFFLLYMPSKLFQSHLIGLLSFTTLLTLLILDIYFLPAYLFALSFLVFYLAFGTPVLPIAKYGDFSYGLYIYAWPIQQLCAAYFNFNAEDYVVYLIMSFTLTLLCAIASWHLIESPCIKWGKNLKDRKHQNDDK